MQTLVTLCSRWWWAYIFENLHGTSLKEKIVKIYCRMTYHSCDTIRVWNRSIGVDPVVYCKRCGDALKGNKKHAKTS